MPIKTTRMTEGQIDRVTGWGRHIYVIRAPFGVKLRATDENGNPVFEAEAREAMKWGPLLNRAQSLEFTSLGDQIVSIWWDDQAFDYGGQAGINTSSKVEAFTVAAPLGVSQLVAYAAFKMRVKIKPAAAITIGDENVTALGGWPVDTNEVLPIETRADVYAWVPPGSLTLNSAAALDSTYPAGAGGITKVIYQPDGGMWLCSGSKLYQSTDEGASWTERASAASYAYLMGVFKGDVLWIEFNGQTISTFRFKADGSYKAVVTGNSPYSAFSEGRVACSIEGKMAYSKKGGGASELRYVAESTDGGITWQDRGTCSTTVYGINGLGYIGEELFCVGQQGIKRLERETNEWTPLTGSFDNAGAYQPFAVIDNKRAYVAVPAGVSDYFEVYFTSDGGESFSYVCDRAAGSKTVFAVGETLVIPGTTEIIIIPKPGDTPQSYPISGGTTPADVGGATATSERIWYANLGGGTANTIEAMIEGQRFPVLINVFEERQ